MSFFDDTKNAGVILLIIALLEIIFTAIAAFAFEPYKDAELWKQIMMIVGVSTRPIWNQSSRSVISAVPIASRMTVGGLMRRAVKKYRFINA